MHVVRRVGRHGRGQRLLIALVACTALLSTAACGTRWSGDEKAQVAARYAGGGAGPAETAGGRGGTAIAGDPSDAGAGSGAAGAAGGPSGAPAGAAAGGGAADAGGSAVAGSGLLPCAAPSDAPGVTDGDIAVATISTTSGPVPGLGASALGAARAYIAYRNATGGVCGRQIVHRTADDGSDAGRHRALTSELDSQVLGIVGGLGTGDAGSADVVASNGIPVVVTAISEQYQNAATVFDINPPFADVNAVIGKYRWLHEQGATKAALVYLAVDQTRAEIDGKQKPQMLAAGIQIVLDEALPLSTLSYDSAARAVANSGADYLFFLADAGASASMAQSMADTGYQGLRFEEYLTSYGSNFIELAGAASEGASSWIRTLPNEDGGRVPEQAAFLEWMAQVSPDVVADTFAADSWAAAKAFFDSLEALPGPITRDALLTQLRATTSYDAGGLLGVIQLGPKLHNGCHVGMLVENGAWRRLTPSEGFLC